MTDLALRIRCPGCGAHMDLKASDLASGALKRCIYCGAKVLLSGENGSDVQQAADDLARSLDELSRVLKVEL